MLYVTHAMYTCVMCLVVNEFEIRLKTLSAIYFVTFLHNAILKYSNLIMYSCTRKFSFVKQVIKRRYLI
jgi:hypothetical protein